MEGKGVKYYVYLQSGIFEVGCHQFINQCSRQSTSRWFSAVRAKKSRLGKGLKKKKKKKKVE
jgi:hypothetical protein